MKVRIFAGVVLTLCFALVLAVYGQPARVQVDTSVDHYRIEELDRRMTAWDGHKLVERMSRLELLVENAHKLMMYALGGIITLIVERVFRLTEKLGNNADKKVIVP